MRVIKKQYFMTQKQTFGIVLGVAGVIVAGVFIVQQYSRDIGNTDTSLSPGTTSSQQGMTGGEQQVVIPIPETIDGIVEDIATEATSDLLVLDTEEAASLEEMNQDSDSVNNLGTSYDENNL